MKYALVVDDDPLVSKSLVRLLKGLDLGLGQILTAADGQEGLKTFQEDPAGCLLVLSDYDMPRMNGEELARALRQQENYQGPLAIISGGHTSGRRARLAELSVTCFDKPYSIDKFGAYVQKAVKRG